VSKLKIRALEVDYHRNGTAGTGFHVVRFFWGSGPRRDDLYVATVFPEKGSVAVLKVDTLVTTPAGYAVPHYRAEDFEKELRAAVLAFEEARAGAPLDEKEKHATLAGT
jgi:hypothetical protein